MHVYKMIMKVEAEIYKGIEFIRISSLPETQKEHLLQSFDKHKIIKILKSDSLLSDCILLQDYTEWLPKTSVLEMVEVVNQATVEIQPVLKLA